MLLGLLQRLRNTPSLPDPAPVGPMTVIGDVHGRLDLLHKALASASGTVVLVGDYIDRGENSAGVLRFLSRRDDLICLGGNHEDMLLGFLDDPVSHGPPWLRHGGLQTLASFGVTCASETSAPDALKAARDDLRRAMGRDLIAWVRTRPSLWQSGNIVVTHAGADPVRPPKDQDPHNLRWGHPDFAKTPRRDGLWVVHGHVVVDAPTQANGRVNVDTGAYATGRLSCAWITAGQISFETVT